MEEKNEIKVEDMQKQENISSTVLNSQQEETLEETKDSKKKNKKDGKKKKVMIVIILLAIAAITTGVFLYKQQENKKTDSVKTDVKELHSEYRMSGNGLEDFDLRFLQLEANDKNVVYSPLSIKYALAMLKEGTAGNSKEQIAALIGDYKSKKYTNSENMSFANALFVRNSVKDTIKQNYPKTLQNKYNAEVVYDNFDNPDTINSWVSDKTFHRINNLLDNVSGLNFAIVNALAIDMEWKKQLQVDPDHYMDNNYSVSYKHEKYSAYVGIFDKEDCGRVKFNNGTSYVKASEIGASINKYDIVKELGEENIRNTITKEYEEWLKDEYNKQFAKEQNEDNVSAYVDKFIQELNSNYKRIDASTDFKFYVGDDAKVFSKELKEYNNTTLEYIGIMPKDKSLNDFIKNMNAKNINSLIGKLKNVELDSFEEGKVTKIVGGIPLFNYDYELDLNSDLKKLGVTDIFNKSKLDISNLTTSKDISIDTKHKANIEFSNDGIKASAATIIGGLGSTGAGFEHLYEVPVVTIDLTFDNPYLYLIRDKQSGEIWFAGAVYEPTPQPKNTKIINE